MRERRAMAWHSTLAGFSRHTHTRSEGEESSSAILTHATLPWQQQNTRTSTDLQAPPMTTLIDTENLIGVT